jgi:hypothetical protein
VLLDFVALRGGEQVGQALQREIQSENKLSIARCAIINGGRDSVDE